MSRSKTQMENVRNYCLHKVNSMDLITNLRAELSDLDRQRRSLAKQIEEQIRLQNLKKFKIEGNIAAEIKNTYSYTQPSIELIRQADFDEALIHKVMDARGDPKQFEEYLRLIHRKLQEVRRKGTQRLDISLAGKRKPGGAAFENQRPATLGEHQELVRSDGEGEGAEAKEEGSFDMQRDGLHIRISRRRKSALRPSI